MCLSGWTMGVSGASIKWLASCISYFFFHRTLRFCCLLQASPPCSCYYENKFKYIGICSMTSPINPTKPVFSVRVGLIFCLLLGLMGSRQWRDTMQILHTIAAGQHQVNHFHSFCPFLSFTRTSFIHELVLLYSNKISIDYTSNCNKTFDQYSWITLSGVPMFFHSPSNFNCKQAYNVKVEPSSVFTESEVNKGVLEKAI